MKELKMLGIDLGASSGRGIVGSFNGEKLTLTENHRFANEPVIQNGRFSWDILRIFHEIKNSIRKCVLNGDELASIGIDTWGVDYGFIDKNGHLIANPAHYRDSRTEGIMDYVNKTIPLNDIYDRTGIQAMNFNTIFQLAADARDNPELLNYAKHLLFIPDLLGYFLTGNIATEATIASTGAILNPKTKQYDFELLDKLGIPRHLFSNIVAPGSRLGSLLPQVLEETGNTTANVVKIASHDTASAVIAVPSKEESFIYISSGTWSLMGTELKEPIINEAARNAQFTNESGAENTIRYLKNIIGLWLIQESRRQWQREGTDYSFDELTSMAREAKPFACFINPDDPIFVAPGNMPLRVAEYCKKTGQYVPQTNGEIIRCILESLALRYRFTVNMIKEFMPKAPTAIHVVGGGCQNTLLCALTADACGLPVYAGPVEATAIGNISMQAIATGELKDVAQARDLISRSFELKIFEPTPSNSGMWDDAFERFCKLTNM